MSQYFEVTAVSGGGDMLDRVGIEEGVRTVSIKMKRNISLIKDFIALINLIYLFLKEKPEIVHTHTPKAGLLGMVAAWITRIPVRMHTVAGMPLMESSGLKRKILNMMEIVTYKCAHMIYPNSKGLLQFIVENNFTNPKKLKLIGNGSSNGINLDYYNPVEISEDEVNKIRSKYKLTKQDFIFIIIGRVVKDKGVEELVSAFNRLSSENNSVKLFILGRFEEKLDPISSEIKDIIKNNDNILYAGYQTDIRPFLKTSNVLIHPSYREGFPNVVLQASAFNLPCIVSDINGNNEIIQDNLNGLIVSVKSSDELYKQMSKIYNDPKLLTKLKQKSRKFIEDRFEQNYV
ncbi:glycosyltransferase family 4 protein, partial [Bacteroidota bacterium]